MSIQTLAATELQTMALSSNMGLDDTLWLWVTSQTTLICIAPTVAWPSDYNQATGFVADPVPLCGP